MNSRFISYLSEETQKLKDDGLFKEERFITSPQKARIKSDRAEVINLCANNYLGLCDDQRLIEAGQKALSELGFGMSSVRFICGTHRVHKTLEQKISEFLEMQDTILYSSCFDANAGLFETLLLRSFQAGDSVFHC